MNSISIYRYKEDDNMENKYKNKLKNHKQVLLNSKGSSFIELMYVIAIFIMIFSILMQIYLIVHGETLVINSARYALRQVEKTGSTNGVEDNVKDTLSKDIKIIPSKVTVSITDEYNHPKSKFQLREKIKVKITVQYSLFDAYKSSFFEVPLTCTYVGSSEKFDKTLGAYTAIE